MTFHRILRDCRCFCGCVYCIPTVTVLYRMNSGTCILSMTQSSFDLTDLVVVMLQRGYKEMNTARNISDNSVT
jgi:hypothetical protein